MKRSDFYKAFEDLISVEPDSLTGQEELETLQEWDSLAILEFVAFCDKQFNFVPDPTQIESCKTVNDLIVLLDGRVD